MEDIAGVREEFALGRVAAVNRYRDFVLAGWNEGHRHEFTGGGLIRSAGGREALTGHKFEDREAADDRILGSDSFVEDVWR